MHDLHTRKVKETGRIRNDLYYWKNNIENKMSQSLVATMTQSTALCHRRLEYVPHRILQQTNICNGSKTDADRTCSICPLAKQTRLPFPQSTSRVVKLFELVLVMYGAPTNYLHMVVRDCFHSLVNDYSRMVSIFLLRLKSDISIVMKDFIPLIKTQFDGSIKVFRSNNGTSSVA